MAHTAAFKTHSRLWHMQEETIGDTIDPKKERKEPYYCWLLLVLLHKYCRAFIDSADAKIVLSECSSSGAMMGSSLSSTVQLLSLSVVVFVDLDLESREKMMYSY